MTTTSIQEQIDEIFADARRMHSQAVERLEQGDIRDAAEKAWCATKRATDALLLARTGEPPGPTGHQRPPRRPGLFRSSRCVATGPLLQPSQPTARRLFLHWRMQPAHRAPHQGNRRLHCRCRNTRRRVSVRRHSNRLVELHRDTPSFTAPSDARRARLSRKEREVQGWRAALPTARRT